MLKVSQILAFNEVMLTGSISQAARHLHRTQSSISATIAGIEDELQMSLFERRNGRLHPVPEAHYLQNECAEILRRLETVSDNMHRIKSLQSGELHIASMPGPSVFFLPNLIAQHGSERPDVRTNLVSRSAEGVYRLISSQHYDFGLADYSPDQTNESSLIDSEVFEFRCQCALHADHPLADNPVLSPRDLDTVPLATLSAENSVHTEIQNAFAQQGLRPGIRHTTQYFLSLFNYVEKKLACAIVDPISIESYRAYKESKQTPLLFRPFSPAVYFRVALITPRHRPSSVIAGHFHSLITKSFKSIEAKYR